MMKVTAKHGIYPDRATALNRTGIERLKLPVINLYV